MSSPVSPPVGRRATLFTVSVTQLMVSLDATIMSIAIPQAQRDLGFSSTNRQWLITAYVLAFGGFLFVGGRVGDRWGHRRTLIVGLVGFAGASALGGDAHSFSLLVTSRALQGVAGALCAPAALALLSLHFRAAQERSRAFALFGSVGASGAAIGLLLGALLTQWSSWRWCLDVNVVLALGALAGSLRTPAPERTSDVRGLDPVGAVLSAAGWFGVVYGLSHGVRSSWTDRGTWLPLAFGVACGIGFVLVERGRSSALVPLRLVTARTRTGSLGALFLANAAFFGASLFLSVYLQSSLGYSPLRSGVMFLPLIVAIAVSASGASARLWSVVGPRPLVPVGMILAVMGSVLFTRLPATPNYWGSVFPGLVLIGLGLGLIVAPASASATAALNVREVGAASALVNSAQQIGASVGLALLNTIAVESASRAEGAGSPIGAATLHGYAVAFWWVAGLFAVGAVVSLVMLETGTPHAVSESMT